MTLRDFLNAVKHANEEMLDSPIVIRLDTYDHSYTSPAKKLGSYTENIYIGPDGIITQTEALQEYGLQLDVPESKFYKTHNLLIPSNCAVIDVEPLTDKQIISVEPDAYIPHYKLEQE